MASRLATFASFLKHGSNIPLIAGIAGLPALSATGKLPLSKRAIPFGIALFFASEYGFHRYALHAEPMESSFLHGLQRRLHYDHHVEPARLDLLFLPIWAYFPTQALFAGLYQAIGRRPGVTAGLVLGNFIGAFYYEWVHYVAHIPYQPRTPWGKYMKKYHLWHHFKNEKLWYGVTNPLSDHLIGTYTPVDEAERSSSVKVLYATNGATTSAPH